MNVAVRMHRLCDVFGRGLRALTAALALTMLIVLTLQIALR